MPASVLRPAEIGSTDADRILRFLNGVADATALAETVGFSDGLSAGRRVAAELIAARPLRSLDQVLGVTGVSLLRFTEIAIALSAARPPLAADELRFLPLASPALWLGQTVSIAAQQTNPEGLGIVTRQVTCIASDGVLTARSGPQTQTGTAIRIAPEPGGLVHFSYGPRLMPHLNEAERAALNAELSRLDGSALTPADGEESIKTLAAHYRGQGTRALQNAIDRLFEAYDAPIHARLAPWPVQPVTLLALTHDEAGQVLQAASLTLDLRNWLGAFYTALARQIDNDPLLPKALENLAADAQAGRNLSRKLIQATRGYSALERGALGRRLRDDATGRMVNAFLDRTARTLEGDAVVKTVRAAGASKAAISAGGFAVFDAIRTVQEAEDAIKPTSKLDGLTRDDLKAFDQRLAHLEDSAVTDDVLARFERRLTADLDSRVAALENDSVTRSDLDSLRVSLTKDFDAKLEAIDPGARFDERLATIDERLVGLEKSNIRQRDLDQLRTDLRNLESRVDTGSPGGGGRIRR